MPVAVNRIQFPAIGGHVGQSDGLAGKHCRPCRALVPVLAARGRPRQQASTCTSAYCRLCLFSIRVQPRSQGNGGTVSAHRCSGNAAWPFDAQPDWGQSGDLMADAGLCGLRDVT